MSASGPTKYCYRCGARNEPDAQFCTSCQAKLPY